MQQIDVFTIAAFIGIVFSVLIGIAISASNQSEIFSNKRYSIAVHGMFVVGLLGLIILPIFLTCNINTLGSQEQIGTWTIDILVGFTVFFLGWYYFIYLWGRTWRGANVETILPPDAPNVL